MIIEPYSKSITMPKGVSQQFHDAFKKNYGKEVLPIDPNLKKREPKANSKPALTFSGGVDSTVAAILLPKDTVCMFVDRDSEKAAKPGLYNKSSAYHAIEGMKNLGHHVLAIKTDFEFIRDPVGFAWGVSSTVPVLLLADHFNLDSVALGMILESAYAIGNENYREFHYPWFGIFEAAGLPCNLVTAGLSEVATTKLVMALPEYHSFAQSCIRGEPNRPCLKCLKCFRKLMLETALKQNNIENLNLDQQAQLPEVFKHINQTPIHHENIYSFSLSNYVGVHPFLKKFSSKVRAGKIPVTWMEKWYSPSKSLIIEKYRDYISEQIQKFIPAMNANEENDLHFWRPYSLMTSWSPSSWIYRRNAKKFTEWMFAKSPKLKKLYR
ncbi:MAG: hypothetical protein IT286_01875, partial [Proteobacteria bacterium]|nr:hypothetical protein [Pseudomonadota bacterium]